MITFITSILLLIAGYFIYGNYVEKKFGSDDSIPTPVKSMADGVDYVELPGEFSHDSAPNIAGLNIRCYHGS